MPEFDPDTVRTLVGDLAHGDHTLDLRGVSSTDAKSAISDMLDQSTSHVLKKVVVRIDPATSTSGETLFLPVGQQLLEARKQGLITRLQTLPEADGGGFYIELTGHPRDEETQQ